MIYCNSRNGEVLSPSDLRVKLNTSFPDGMMEVNGWHLVDEISLYPNLAKGQIAVQNVIVERDGRWMMTYSIVESSSTDSDMPEEETLKERCATLEKALADLAYIVSSLEIERMERADKESE